ncbi:TIGR02302 family protein, partial [Methylopila musalis]
IFLTAARAPGDAAPEVTRAPTGSILVVRIAGGTAEVSATGGLEDAKPVDAKSPEGMTEHRYRLTGAAGLTVAGEGEAAPWSWRFSAIPDAAPTIRLSEPPQRNARGGATLRYEVTDDYGVASAEARFALKPAETPKDGQAEERRPLYEAPKIALTLPRKRAREGKGQTSLDLAEHPFAGADAVMTLAARDEAGQEGLSAPETLRIPGRPFVNPLARALVEQRRTLALDANAKPDVARALQALMLFPEEFTPKASVYLGLRAAYRRLDIARTDDELRAVADHLWEMALRLEDGDLPDAERQLRQAEEALRKALEDGASEQEIAKLTEELRKALDAFMKELAQRAQQQPNPQARAPQNGAQTIRPDDLRKMIDRMEQMAKSGSREAAQQALNELREMLDNLRTAQPGQQQQGDHQQSQSQQQMDKLQDMIREQNKLRDQTYQQYRQQERSERNQRGREGQPRRDPNGGDTQALAEQQRQLQRKLDELMQEMAPGGQPDRPNQPPGPGEPGGQGQQQQQQGRNGEGQDGQGQQGQRGQGQGQQGGQQGQGGGQGQDPLGEAGRSMGDARGALGQGRTGQALDDQSRALENLRKGAQALAEQMRQQGQQEGQQPGQGQQGAENGQADGRDDPLGRPVRRRESDGTGTKVPGEIEAQRARRVLEELRRRIGENERPREELDYLERLLAP